MTKHTAHKETIAVTVGIDLGDKQSNYCIVAHDGTVLEEGKLATTSQGFQQRFAEMRPVRILLEAGTHSMWVSRLLLELGHEALVVDPRKLEVITKSTRKTDRHDASTLALLGRIDTNLQLLNTITHRPPELQVDLDILRSRDVMVRARTMLITSVRGFVKNMGGRLPACSASAFVRKAGPHIPFSLKEVLAEQLDEIAHLSEAIARMDKQVARCITERYPQAEVLMQVPGVGPLTALAFVLTLADPERFSSSRKVGAYLGLVPRRHQSGGRDPKLSITKAGDPYLRRLLVTAAHYILGPFGPDTTLRRFGLALAARADKRCAVVAVARKLSSLLHHLWLTGEVYEPLRGVPKEVLPAA